MEKLQVYVQNSKNEPLDYDYDLELGACLINLNFSDNPEWASKGENALTITDSGDGLSIKFPDRKAINLLYSEARELFIALSMSVTDKIEIRKSEIIKTF
jgi:hypothetical protein